MIYVIDTDSFIALRRIYSPRHFESLWHDIEVLIAKDHLISTRINYEELKITDDSLYNEWKIKHREMFIEIDESIQGKVTEILSIFSDLIDVDNDKEQADPYVIAAALVKEGTVISEETALSRQAMADPKRKSKMKIPNVCAHFGVPCMNIVQFINHDEWREYLKI
jgi:hypothetical protein